MSIKTLTADEIKTAGFGESFLKDSTAGTWLPLANAPAPQMNPQIGELLKPLSASMRLLSCWYNGSKLLATRTFANGVVHTAASSWSAQTQVTPVAGEKDAMDVTLTFKLVDGSAAPAGVAAAFDFSNWSTGNYVLIPASVYNGNRERIVGGGYASGLPRTDLYRKDLPLSVRQLPHLALEPGEKSKIEVSSCNATTPAICVYEPGARRGFIVLAEQGIHVGDKVLDNGLGVEESPDRSHATLVVSAPGVREQKPEFIGFSASPDRGIAWKPGDSVTMHLRVYGFEASEHPGPAGQIHDRPQSGHRARITRATFIR